MDTTEIRNESLNFGYFEVDSRGFIQDLSPNLCTNFDLNKEDFSGALVDTFFTSQISQKEWKNQGEMQQVIYGVINENPCLVQITPLFQEERDGYRCHVILRKQDIKSKDIFAFSKSFQSEVEAQRKKKSQHNFSHKYSFDQIIAESPAMNEVIRLASRVAKSRSTILLTGESGTGKELFTQSIHDLSPRREGPFVAINCAAIPEALFESELFGYEGGSFSGAKREGKAGKIELAENGTLFLDEISELPLLMQGKLLRVLQEREVERIGSTGSKMVDIRIITATNKSLEELVKEGKFRQDLYYRLKVFEIRIPPLRERKEDILNLTWSFIESFNNQLGTDVRHIDLSLKQWLLNYHWPGNVRELQGAIERGMNIADGDTLYLEHVGLHSELYSEDPVEVEEFLPLEEEVAKAEISAIRRALDKANGDRMAAAHILKIHIASLYRKLNKYNMK